MVHHKHAADTRKPYSGLSRSLVIAIDVGTTFSGVSYAILEPGEIPKIHGVTRFPGQEHVAGNSKIPSVIYYDKHGNIMAAGAEADNSSVAAQAEDDGWIKAELFKLRLRPRTMQLNMNGMRLSPLPKRKTPIQIFGDYLSYLYRCTRIFITDTHANGIALWNSVEPDIQFVLSHPNGWEGPQQTRMRNAAVYGKLVQDTDEGRARIRFVTEGEASLHACVLSGLADDVLSNPSKHGFLIADAGGGTLDISAYAIKGTSPLAMEEIAPPDCIFAGSVFVSRRAREFLEDKLKNSKYGTADSLDHITRKFDETTKRLFRDRHELQFIPFGSPLDKDPAVGIRSGQLRLTGNEVANLFEPSVDAAVNAIKAQIEASNGIIRSVFLVGGYAASPWLFGQLQERLAPFRITVSRPDTQTSKAVADGAIGFYCDHHVSARMSKFMYGVEFLRELDPNDPEHVRREGKLCELPSGPRLLPDAFDCILARSVKVKESTVFTRKYCTELTNLSMLSVFEVEIWCYRGGNTVPKWINRHDDSFSTLCVVQADLSLLNGSAEPKMGRNGKKYWTIVFSVEIHFGLTEFKARIKWMDNGQVKYGPAVIVYNERGHRIEDDDIDVYPEDEQFQSQQAARSDRSRGERSSPSSRSRTPIDSSYNLPPASAVGGSSRRSSNVGVPDMSRLDTRSVSKGGYAPSITPSARSGATVTPRGLTGSDGDRGSDSDRRKGKDKERDRYRDDDRGYDRTRSTGSAAPSMYGSSPMARIGSTGSAVGGGAGDSLSSNWNNGPGAGIPGAFPSSRSPSVRPPHSRSTSIYGGGGGEPSPVAPSAGGGGGGGEWGSGGGGGHDWNAPPRSAVDDQRQSHLWGEQAPSIMENTHDRPKTPYVDRPKSPYGQDHHDGGPPGAAGEFDFGAQDQQYQQQGPVSAYGRAASPFVDRPKSGVENSFFDRPKSAFGDAPPPAMFGDTGPAAEAGGVGTGASLFGEPPASVFGDSGHADADAQPTDSWGFGAAVTPTAAEPPATTPTSKKGKKKTTAAATPVASTPSGGFGSRVSPSFGAGKSPFGTTTNAFDDSGAGAGTGAGTGGTPPVAPGGGLWGTGAGSKAPSPYDKGKPLSPLNPASRMDENYENHDQYEVQHENETKDEWGFNAGAAGGGGGGGGGGWGTSGGDTGGGGGWGASGGGGGGWGGGGGGGDTWGQDANLNEPQKEPSRAPSPAPPVEPVAVAPVEDTTAAGKKKKKKGALGTKTTPGLSFDNDDEEKQKKEQEEQKEKERQEEEDRKQKEEQKRLDDEKAEKERKEKEEQENAAAHATSLFGNTGPMFSDTGGGDDSWGGSFGAPMTAAAKKKKGKLGATPTSTTAPASTFGGITSSWGGPSAFGSDPVEPSDPLAPSTKTSPKQPAKDLFNFNSPGPELQFDSFGASGASPAVADPAAETPADVVSPTGENAEGTGDAGAAGGDEDKGDGKKKKKKKKAGGADEPDGTPAAEEPPTAESLAVVDAAPEPPPAAVEPVVEAAGGAKKKKKKGK